MNFKYISNHFTATKNDLAAKVSAEQGAELARKINANKFLECSAKQYVNINEVIHEAVRASEEGVPPPEEVTLNCCEWLKCW